MAYVPIVIPARGIVTREFWQQVAENIQALAPLANAVGENEIAIGAGVDKPGFIGLPLYGGDDVMVVGRNNNLVRHIFAPPDSGKYLLSVDNSGVPEWQDEDTITGNQGATLLIFMGLR